MRKVFSFLLLIVATVTFLPPPALLVAGTEVVQWRTAVPRFTLDQAILTALQRNADIQKARQDIERTKGLYIEMRAAILPKLDVLTNIQNTDPHLGSEERRVGKECRLLCRSRWSPYH